MAPSTRLGARPERRVDYRHAMSTGRAGSARNPIVLGDTPPPPEAVTRPTKTKDKAATEPARDARGRFIKSEASAKPKPDRKKVVKVVKVAPPPKPKKQAQPEKTECIICATTKDTKRNFKASDVEGTCEHFQSVCDCCVQKQVKTKMAARQLTDANLPCMLPDCKAVLDHTALKTVMPKALFDT